MNYKRLIPIITPILIFVLSQIFLATPKVFYYALGIGVLIIVISVKYLSRGIKNNWLIFTISPVLFFLSFSLYSSLIANSFLIQFIFVLCLWFIFSYLKNLYYFLSYEVPERAQKLDHLILSGGFLTFFALTSSLYGLPIFLNWPFFKFLLVFIPLAFLLLIQFFAIKKISFKPFLPFIGINILILSELALVLSFLPFNFNVLGFLLTIFFYFFLLVFRLRLREELNYHNLKLPIVFSLLIIVITILSARWL